MAYNHPNSFANMNKIDSIDLDHVDESVLPEVPVVEEEVVVKVCEAAVPDVEVPFKQSFTNGHPLEFPKSQTVMTHEKVESFGNCEIEFLEKECIIIFSSDELNQITEKYAALGMDIKSQADLAPFIKNIYLKALNIKNESH